MRVLSLHRYPVKSMLGEPVDRVEFTEAGVRHDRTFALVDAESGLVASAKHPRLWRSLLQYSAHVGDGTVEVASPQGWTHDVVDARLAPLLSEALGRSVRVVDRRADHVAVERPDPQDVIEHGVEAAVPAALLEIGQGTPGTTFVDYAPVHLITTATLDRLDVDPRRYRPNVIIETPSGTAYGENDWVGRELDLGDVRLEVVLPTPRCAVPTLAHGSLPSAPHAVRTLMDSNRIDVPGFGTLPCAGVYARVLRPGHVERDTPVVLR